MVFTQNLRKLVENNLLKTTGRKYRENLAQIKEIISAKYSGNFVIVLCY